MRRIRAGSRSATTMWLSVMDCGHYGPWRMLTALVSPLLQELRRAGS